MELGVDSPFFSMTSITEGPVLKIPGGPVVVDGAPEAAESHGMHSSLTSSDYSFSNDIYLNATEEAIKELLQNGTVSDRAFNFDFYTKMDVKTNDGSFVTVNLKLTSTETPGTDVNGDATIDYSFVLNSDDIDVGVETFYNVAEDDGAAVTSSGEAGDFVKIDNAGDIALGNGGDDTYVIGTESGDIVGGVALEYGEIGSSGGLTNSTSDAVNFNSVKSVDELTFTRGQHRNEEDGNTLFISDKVDGAKTVLFDNYNEHLDFRRVEYLTVEDGSNNDEIYEIVTKTNLDWENEIYVADNAGGSMTVELGGTDYVIGSQNTDNVMIDLGDLLDEGPSSGTINLSGFDTEDAITGDTITLSDDGKLNQTHEDALQTVLDNAMKYGDTVTLSTDGSKLNVDVDYASDEDKLADLQFEYSFIA